jgi:hypothetical protein
MFSNLSPEFLMVFAADEEGLLEAVHSVALQRAQPPWLVFAIVSAMYTLDYLRCLAASQSVIILVRSALASPRLFRIRSFQSVQST